VTVLVGGMSLLLAVALAWFGADLSGAAARKARAQIAADAAALAAVAESTPFGGGRPKAIASRYARLNGATLVGCLCPVGATAVQVTVEVEEVTAQARAVFDPNAVMAAGGEGALDPALASAVGQLLDASAGRVTLVSGYRTHAEQENLWAEALARHGDAETADDWVAPPGSSMHERGLAVDLGGDLELAARLIERLDLPLVRPLANEPWHFELAVRV